MASSRTARASGARKLVLGGLGWAVAGGAFYALHASGHVPKGRTPLGLLIALGLPGSFALAGALELLTGKSFAEHSAAWDSLAGWQRGALGLLVVAAAVVVVMTSIALLFGDFDSR